MKPKPRNIRILRMIHKDELTREERRILKTWRIKKMDFLKTFKKGCDVYLEDSVMWYCLDMGIERYLQLSIQERINLKDSYFN